MNETVGPEDVRAAAAACREALSDVVELDWSVRAGGRTALTGFGGRSLSRAGNSSVPPELSSSPAELGAFLASVSGRVFSARWKRTVTVIFTAVGSPFSSVGS